MLQEMAANISGQTQRGCRTFFYTPPLRGHDHIELNAILKQAVRLFDSPL